VRVAVVLLRVWIGLHLFFVHGMARARDMDDFLESGELASFPNPELFGWAAVLSLLVGGALLALGAFTRTVASVLLATMLAAAFVTHGPEPWAAKELALTYSVVLVFFVAWGAGDASVDAELARRKKKRSPW
jgi:putative oxidoreductase